MAIDIGNSVIKIQAADIVRLIRSCRFDLSTEKHLQEELAAALERRSIPFEREKHLSARDIPDFFLPGGLVIECKMRNKSKKMDIFRQLERYAENADVTALILASNVSMALPPEIHGKPAYMASISAGWI